MSFIDLHLHTLFSDGSYTPDDLVAAAKTNEVVAFALTDHDTMEGIAPTAQAAAAAGLEFLAGVEITCRLDTTELHLLGYFFGDGWRSEGFQRILTHATRVRDQRVDESVARLQALGIGIERADVEAAAIDPRTGRAPGSFGRPHLARALVARGVVQSVEEAFQRFLRRGKPGYVERYRMTIAEAIGHLHRAGGLAVLAHPGLYRVDSRLRQLVDQGLDGLEAWHSRHSANQTEQYLQLARELGLVATGGSDDHGPGCGDAVVGQCQVPYTCWNALKERASQRAEI